MLYDNKLSDLKIIFKVTLYVFSIVELLRFIYTINNSVKVRVL